MRNLLILTFCLVLFINDYPVYSQKTKYHKVKISIASSTDLERLSSLGIPLDGVYIKKYEYVVGEFSNADIEKIKNQGFNVEVLIYDVSKYYADRNKTSSDTLKKKAVKNVCPEKYPTPANFRLGSIGGYFSYDEIVSELDSLRIKFPQLVSPKIALSPLSIEGRTIWAIKLSDNPDITENEPRILFVALNHAREPMGMQQLFFLMYYLLENYTTNPSIQYLLNNLEIYFIPCVNPDGYVFNNETYPEGGGMHRKNCRVTGADNFGVDLNRNYGYMWGYDDVGSSPDIESEIYRGTGPFSEPETQAIKAFVEQKQFALIMDYHCYSNVLIYPWSYINMLTPDNNVYQALSEILTETNGFTYGTAMETIGYNANGVSADWYYGEQTTKPKIFAWIPEAGNANDGFYPVSDRIEEIARSFMDMNLYFMRFALPYLKIEEPSPRFIVNNQKLRISMKNIGMVNPSSFVVTFVPISTELQATQFQQTYNNIPFLQTHLDSFTVILNDAQSWGRELRYCFKVQTSLGYYYTDTFSIVCGMPVTLLEDNGNTMTNWTSTTWNTTTLAYYSPPKSITDSPNGNYPENTTRTITLTNSFSLQNALYAELSYWCKWDIEPLADYVQIQISTNNGATWQPICGKYTRPSFLSNSYQQPIYEGIRDHWVQERIVLNNYLGLQNLKIRFKLQSTYSYTMQNDGFYFDDLKIQIVQPYTSLIHQSQDKLLSLVIYPNPTSGIINVRYVVPEGSRNVKLYITNVLNNVHKSIDLDSNLSNIQLNLDLPAGVYWCKLIGEHGISKPIIIVVEK